MKRTPTSIDLRQPSASAHGQPWSYRTLSAREREEINAIAEAIHRRLFIPERAATRPLVSQETRQLVAAAARQVGAMPNAGTPSQPRRQPLVGQAEEHGRASYGDALQACRLLLAGREAEAREMAGRALAHQAALSRATRALGEQARQHTGRYFHDEILSVRRWYFVGTGDDEAEGALQDGLGPDHFEQWYVRLIVLWDATGQGLVIGNARELEAATGFDVGEDGWRALCRWIFDHSNPEGRARRGRPVDQAVERQLVFFHEPDRDTPRIRKLFVERYHAALRALHCIQRAMRYAGEGDGFGPLLIPDDRPPAGHHHIDWNDTATQADR